MDIARPFIRLPLSFDAKRLAEEATSLPASAWMVHPSRMSGNSAVALISRDGGDNDDFDGAMQETAHLQACPYTRQAIASFGEVFGRSRFMKLSAGAEVSQHVDFNYHWYSRVRIHIPVISNPQVRFFCADEQVNMRPGECWLFNSWRRHRVTNESDRDRIHLVIDTAGSSRFWQMVRDSQDYDPLADAEAIERRVRAIEYRPGQQVEIMTERYNVAPVMSPGELDALVAGLVADFEQNPDNDPALVTRYRLLLEDFARDWREIWHLHGYQASGWPLYRQSVDRVFKSLKADAQPLLTQSNRIRVNPIIVQRILKAALNVDVMDQFTAGLGSKP